MEQNMPLTSTDTCTDPWTDPVQTKVRPSHDPGTRHLDPDPRWWPTAEAMFAQVRLAEETLAGARRQRDLAVWAMRRHSHVSIGWLAVKLNVSRQRVLELTKAGQQLATERRLSPADAASKLYGG